MHPDSSQQNVLRPSAPIDLDELVYRCLGEIEFAQSIVEQFLENWSRDQRQLEQAIAGAVADHDSSELRRVAHRVKGTAATIAAHGLVKQLQQLEENAGSGNVEYFQHTMEQLNSEVQRVSLFAENLVEHS